MDSAWDAAFGGEAGLYRIDARRRLIALGLATGGVWYSAREGGRVWVHGELGLSLLGRVIGISAGPTVELDDERPPRWGAQGSLWVFAGVIPYLRIGAVQDTGAFFEAGIRISLPTLRW